jgi:small-conductance mechanosensitive channel
VNTQTLQQWFNQFVDDALVLISSPPFFVQLGFILLAVITALSLTLLLKKRSPLFRSPPAPGSLYALRTTLYQLAELLFPLFNILALSIAVELSNLAIQQSWLVRIAESLAVIFMLYSVLSRFIRNPLVKSLIKWIAIPIAILQIFGWLDEVTGYLETIRVEVGNIEISAYGLVRVTLFGLLLFWLGSLSNRAGQRMIRSQQHLEAGTREVFAKLFQVGVFFLVFLLLLQVMGINLTALAVFGGALGVGLGFGLQSIASNFISGIIILLDRSLTVGDYVELEDGQAGTIRELNMRSTTLETYDGKDVMVPNERFITSQFINWTHKNKKQRYDLTFSVAYSTDLHALFKLVREVVASHPEVLSGPELPIEEQPDAEIQAFGDSGIEILVEFWMEAIDDGRYRVRADLLLMIWDALKEHGIEIPFPQREVRILNPGPAGGASH